MLTIRKLGCGAYRVHHINSKFSDTIIGDFYNALNLCRLRCNTNLKENKIKVIKVPFISVWLVW